MFDPTVFDNLKVVLEGAVYDLDFKGEIEVVDRSDVVDLAKMSRSYSVSLAKNQVEGMIELNTDVENWSGEIMENGDSYPCNLFIQFYLKVNDIDHACSGIRFRLSQIWRPYKPKIEQQISFSYKGGEQQTAFYDQINLFFSKSVDESFMTDIPQLLELAIESLNALQDFIAENIK